MHGLLCSMQITGMGAIEAKGTIVSSVTAFTKKQTALTTSSKTSAKVGQNTGLRQVFGCNVTPTAVSECKKGLKEALIC
jgi:hypothetical protein